MHLADILYALVCAGLLIAALEVMPHSKQDRTSEVKQ